MLLEKLQGAEVVELDSLKGKNFESRFNQLEVDRVDSSSCCGEASSLQGFFLYEKKLH